MPKMYARNLRRTLALFFAASSVFLIPASHAQTTQTQDTTEQRRRAQQEAQERLQQQQAPHINLQGGQPAAPGQLLPQEAQCFKINRIQLEVPAQLPASAHRLGASALPQDPFRFAQDYLDRYAGQCIGRNGLDTLLKNLTARLLEKGYTTTRIGIPEQELATGVLRISLVPGTIRSIRFAAGSASGSWKSAFPARPGDLLNLRDIEQGLEQMKRVPSQDADMQIEPGALPGESDVVINLKRSKPWRVAASLDDSGAKGTGKLQAGLNLSLDNPFGINDLFSAGINGDADNNNASRGTQGGNLYYSAPYGNWLFTLSASTYQYHQRIAGVSQTFVSSGRSHNLDLKAAWLFHRDQSSKTSLQFRTAKRWSHSYVDDTEINVQHRVNTLAEIALLHKRNIGEAQLDASAAWRMGVPWFGAQPDLAGRQASDPTWFYTMQVLDATLSDPFKVAGHPAKYTGTLHAQATRSPLFASDYFSIGNRWTVRGFDGENTLSAEQGWFLRNEIETPIAASAHSAFIGLDLGKVYGNNVQNLLGNKLAGTVLGLRGSITQGFSYEAFAGWVLYKPRGFTTSGTALGFSMNYQF